MSKLKLLMVGNLPIDLKSIKGGVEAAILNLYAGYSSLQDEIDVVHISFSDESREVQYSSNIKIIFLSHKGKFDLLDYLLNRSSLKRIIDLEKPDIIHVQESGPHLLRFIGWPKRNFVVTQHGIMKEELKYAKGPKNKIKYLFKAQVERFVFPAFKNVIFISEYNRKLYRGNLTKSALIGNAVNPIFFEDHNQSPANTNSIIYVGVINKRKNLKLVIEALYQLKLSNIQFNLNVVGGYKERDVYYEKEISALISKYKLANQVRFHGWLKQHEILKIYDDCGIFILPSLQETLPISIAEAMALGKIVVASEVGAISEMFVDKSSGFLFEKNNLNNLIGVLKSINDNKNMNFGEWTDRIRNIARLKYHPLEIAKKTLEFYKSVLASTSNQ